MTREYPAFLIPHSEHGDAHCPGTIWPLRREGADVVDFYCNDCDALVRPVSLCEFTATIEEMRIDKGPGIAAFCGHCGQINEFPGYEKMFAFTCRHCGQSVTLSQG